jgi:hypothetical protein
MRYEQNRNVCRHGPCCHPECVLPKNRGQEGDPSICRFGMAIIGASLFFLYALRGGSLHKWAAARVWQHPGASLLSGWFARTDIPTLRLAA